MNDSCENCIHKVKGSCNVWDCKFEPKFGTWIPVSERLPKENKTVIASTKYGVYPEAKYTKKYGWEWAYKVSVYNDGYWIYPDTNYVHIS